MADQRHTHGAAGKANQSAKPSFSFTPEPPQGADPAASPQLEMPEWSPYDNPYGNLFDNFYAAAPAAPASPATPPSSAPLLEQAQATPTPTPASPTGLQRQMGDGHDLQAPRFAGDPVLEACYDDQQLVKVGASGSAVEKLQQALMDAGFPLPQYGVDGKFGPETKAAVVGFQTSVGFSGKGRDGIVGPNTMAALDERFRTAKPVKPPAKRLKPGLVERHSRSRKIQLIRHKKHVAYVKKILASMKQPGSPAILANTAEWLDPSTPGATAQSQFHVLTSTHDSQARAKHHGHDQEFAYFGVDQSFPDDSADYDRDIDSERNIRYKEPGAAGHQGGGQVFVYNPKALGGQIREILVHEVQHAAYANENQSGGSAPYESPENSWYRYQTEFRSYWVDGGHDGKSDAPGTAINTKFENAKQEAIFLHLYDSSVYPWLKPNYDSDEAVKGQSQNFQDLVHDYTRPRGINLVNSIAIDGFYRQLKMCFPFNKLDDPQIESLEKKASLLSEGDRDYINAPEGEALQNLMKKKLRKSVLKHIASLINNGTEPAWAK
ncbi:MAG: peptidoglycan-binding protein [Leptolyngbya sp. RL_3_1]|nr:peptidoglycan-binding protein [Leptolyngbya sp. RL_3_1]